MIKIANVVTYTDHMLLQPMIGISVAISQDEFDRDNLTTLSKMISEKITEAVQEYKYKMENK